MIRHLSCDMMNTENFRESLALFQSMLYHKFGVGSMPHFNQTVTLTFSDGSILDIHGRLPNEVVGVLKTEEKYD